MYKGGCAFQPITIELGDIKIGAVEIQDAVTNARAAVVNVVGVERLAVDATVAGGVFPLPVTLSAPLPVPVAIGNNAQVQNIERALAVLAPGTFAGVNRNCLNYADFAVSVYLLRNVANDTTVDVVVECSVDGIVWREVDRQVLTISAANPSQNLNRNYTATRQYMRVSLVNNTANVDAEVVTNLKPIG
jgi:hypothetical protein